MKQNINITVDAVIFYKHQQSLRVLLIKRKNEPFKNKYAFPGGFVDDEELVIVACQRELKEETGLHINTEDLKFINYYDAPQRDPRGRTLTFAFAAIVYEEKVVKGQDDAAKANWIDIKDIENLAFDHDTIFRDAISSLNLSPL